MFTLKKIRRNITWLFKDSFYKSRLFKWTFMETVRFFIGSSMANRKCLRFAREYLYGCKSHFLKKFLETKNGKTYYNFNGSKFPLLTNRKDLLSFIEIFSDTFTIPVFWNNDHNSKLICKLDAMMTEGPYGYQEKDGIDVTVKSGDIVFDAGAWIGDFSAYAASQGAISYAFEPCTNIYKLLQQTAELADGNIIPVKLGLSDKVISFELSISDGSTGANSLIKKEGTEYETIKTTTIDNFVKDNHIPKVDFIKSDIEGMERNLLIGARETLRRFAPKLAICTYHLPDDPEVLEKIIKDANPNYIVVQLRHKLMASITQNSDKNNDYSNCPHI